MIVTDAPSVGITGGKAQVDVKAGSDVSSAGSEIDGTAISGPGSSVTVTSLWHCSTPVGRDNVHGVLDTI